MEILHEDLNAKCGWRIRNFINNSTDPTNTTDTTGDHGTSVAGLIAMAEEQHRRIGVTRAGLKVQFPLEFNQSLASSLSSLGGSGVNPKSNDVSF